MVNGTVVRLTMCGKKNSMYFDFARCSWFLIIYLTSHGVVYDAGNVCVYLLFMCIVGQRGSMILR